MKVPKWAEKAFDAQKPRPAAFSETGQADPVALAHWKAYTDRFRNRWHELNPDRWSVPNESEDDWSRFHILTAGLACAKRIAKGQTPAKIVQARKDVLELRGEKFRN